MALIWLARGGVCHRKDLGVYKHAQGHTDNGLSIMEQARP